MTLSKIEKIDSICDFADYINSLIVDLAENPEEWENGTLKNFLAAMEQWLRDADGYSRNIKDENVLLPSWKTFAKILSAAKVYE